MATLEVGSTIPETGSFPDADGTERSLGDALASGPVLLAIYKSSCPACKAMMPMLERIQARYGDDGLTTFGVAQDSANVTQSFARRYGISYPLLVEGPEYPLSRAFDIRSTPTVYVIRPDGTVAYTTMGFLRDQVDEIGAAVAAEVGAEPVAIVTDDDAEVPRFVPG